MRTQQFSPTFFNQPADVGLRECLPQHVNRGQRMDHISHGAEPNNQQPLNFSFGSNIKTRRLETHGCLGPSRERMISLVEWSFGSPTIATRTPYSATASRSRTESAV